MFEAGIIIFLLGCVVRILLRLGTHTEARALAPQRVGERISAIKLMKQKRRLAFGESTVMLIIGTLLILIYGVFN